MTDKAMRDFELAVQLGPQARFRLRAEVLLRNYDSKLTDLERNELIRIACEPQLNDGEYLAEFDRFFEEG